MRLECRSCWRTCGSKQSTRDADGTYNCVVSVAGETSGRTEYDVDSGLLDAIAVADATRGQMR